MLLVFASCGKESACFKSTGEIINEERVFSSEIETINTANNIDLIITQGSKSSLIMEGGSNIIPYINTSISGNELTISNENKCAMLRDYSIPITIYLTVKNLKKLQYTGQGTVTSANTLCFPDFIVETNSGTGSIHLNLKSTNVGIIQHTGSSDITLSGSTNSLYAYLYGTGRQNHEKLNANKVHVKNTGTGDVVVSVNNTLLIELSASGDIFYYGNPNVTIDEHSGSGKLISL